MRIKQFISILICIIPYFSSFAQEHLSVKYAITMQPFQFLCKDIPVTFERVFKRHTLGITLGYRFSSQRKYNPIEFIEYFSRDYPSSGFTEPRFKGITLGTNSKYFVDKTSAIYVEGQLFYRFWWHNNSPYDRYSPGEEYVTSARNHIIGAKVLLGISLAQPGQHKARPICNLYFGLGGRIRVVNEYGVRRENNGYGVYGAYSSYSDKKTQILPTIHLGCNVGLAFSNKEKAQE